MKNMDRSTTADKKVIDRKEINNKIIDRKETDILSIFHNNPLILAPLEGVNCTAFRLLCREYGAGLIYTAMVDTDLFCNDLKKYGEKEAVRKHVNPNVSEYPLTIQIVGSRPDSLKTATEVLSKYATFIDFNLGCALPDILGRKAGVYLMKHNNMLDKLIPIIIEASEVPVTCKIRAGWDEPNAIEIAKQLESLGIAALAIHPRTRKQGYMGRADWDLIKKIKDSVDIPVIGNGDVSKPYHAGTLIGQTGCDAVMIGRAAMGNPSIFSKTLKLVKEKIEPEEDTPDEKIKSFMRFLDLYSKHEARYRLSEIKDHAMWFAKGLPDAGTLKAKIKKSNSEEKIRKIFLSILN